MAFTASQLIKIAEAEIGYLEKKTNANLDNKTDNAGYNNWTKYARDLNKAGYYNGNKNGYAWCDVFVDWLFFNLCNGDAKKAEWIICQTGDYGAGCTWSMRYYKNAGRLHKTPKVGDQIFFGTSSSEVAHTGIVYKVDSSRVYTIEGNTSGASGVVANGGGVCKKSYSLGYAKILGYGRPRYDEDSAENQPTTKEVETVNIELQVLKKGAKNNQVKTLQRILYSMGYDLGSKPVDGSFGPKTDEAVRKFQKDNNLGVDGSVGPKTWNKLLKG